MAARPEAQFRSLSLLDRGLAATLPLHRRSLVYTASNAAA